MSTERNRAASPRSRGGGRKPVLRTAQIRPPDPRIPLCAPENDAKTEDGRAPRIDGVPAGEGGAPRRLARMEENDPRQSRGASDSRRRWRGPADQGRRKDSEDHGGRWGAVCSVTIDFRRSPNNPLSIFLTRTLSTFFFCTNPLSFTPESYLQKLQYPAVILTFKTLFLPSKYHIASLSSLLCAHILRRVLPNMQLG